MSDYPRNDVISQEGAAPPSASAARSKLSVVVPTYKERDNISRMVTSLDRVLAGMDWEVIFVDDASPDGTANMVRHIALDDPRVRLVLRHNRRGLSSAVIEGALAASGEIVAVMDGDLQHDESVLPEMFRIVASDEADIASASRFLLEDGAAGLASDQRRKMSEGGITMANKAFGLDMTDPLTGFFVARRSVFTDRLGELSGQGFKILLDLITSGQERPRVKEVAFKFREREVGESKLDGRVKYDFLLFFIEKKLHPILPLPFQFISFALINGVGIFVHLAVLVLMVGLIGTGFTIAQFFGTLFGMVFNYTVNNAITYSDRKLKGRNFYVGFFIFAVLCSVGVIADIGLANILHERYHELNYVLPATAGALIAVVWNYAATRMLVWGRHARRLKKSNALRSQRRQQKLSHTVAA